jgi:hypothetical protein
MTFRNCIFIRPQMRVGDNYSVLSVLSPLEEANLDHWTEPVQVQVQVTLRLTVSQSVCLGVEPRPGLMTRY